MLQLIYKSTVDAPVTWDFQSVHVPLTWKIRSLKWMFTWAGCCKPPFAMICFLWKHIITNWTKHKSQVNKYIKPRTTINRLWLNTISHFQSLWMPITKQNGHVSLPHVYCLASLRARPLDGQRMWNPQSCRPTWARFHQQRSSHPFISIARCQWSARGFLV